MTAAYTLVMPNPIPPTLGPDALDRLRTAHRHEVQRIDQMGRTFDIVVCACERGAACPVPQLLATIDALTERVHLELGEPLLPVTTGHDLEHLEPAELIARVLCEDAQRRGYDHGAYPTVLMPLMACPRHLTKATVLLERTRAEG